jgi:NodT family efflux transporter outer membrane factor (OMF) lipoprotein
LLCIVGCTLGEDYRRPHTPIDRHESYINAPATLSAALAKGSLSRWWEGMDDALLTRYVSLLLDQNLQLQEAAARIDQAWAQIGIRKGGLWPSLSASVSGVRRMQPINESSFASGIPYPDGIPMERFYTTQWDAGLSTSWQLDLFGKVRRSLEAAQARFEASQSEAEALIHSLIAEVARRRVGIATLQRRMAFARETVESRRLTLRVVEGRYRRGVRNTSALDVYLARENLAAAQADLNDLRREINETVYELDALLGHTPGSTDPGAVDMPLLPPPEPPPLGLPAELLDRRPDLRAAELRLKAATADTGVAIGDLYPDLTVSGTIGFQNNALANWFRRSNLAGDIMGDIMLRLFEGGRLRANIALQQARARELAASYAQQILNALREVETALSDSRYIAARLEHLDQQLQNIRKAEELSWRNYRRGLQPLLDVLEIQRRRYVTEQTYLMAAQSAWNSRIALYLALGGDWIVNRRS